MYSTYFLRSSHLVAFGGELKSGKYGQKKTPQEVVLSYRLEAVLSNGVETGPKDKLEACLAGHTVVYSLKAYEANPQVVVNVWPRWF